MLAHIMKAAAIRVATIRRAEKLAAIAELGQVMLMPYESLTVAPLCRQLSMEDSVPVQS